MISHPLKLRIWDTEAAIYLEETVMWSVAGVPQDMMPGQPPFVPFLMVALLSPATKYVVEQYTGLKDRDGREIYEGDIVRWLNTHNRVIGFGEHTVSTGDEYCSGIAWGWHMGGSALNNSIDLTLAEHLEVIGNIHEHPNLLNT